MRQMGHYTGHSFILLILTVMLLNGPFTLPAHAQDGGDPAAEIEELALQVHLQNVRNAGYTAWIGGGLGVEQRHSTYTLIGERVTGWTLDGFNGDPNVTLNTLTRPALLNFWASWCGPCRMEFPHLAEIGANPHEHNFDVVFISTSDEPGDARNYLDDYPPELITTIDYGQTSGMMRIEALPTSILIDTDGTILVVHIGILSPTITSFVDAVAAHPGVGTFDAAGHVNAGAGPGAVVQPVDVNTAQPIVNGARVTGAIDNVTPQVVYRFGGKAGDQITVSMTKTFGDLDCTIVLLTADGQRLAENDDIERGVITDSLLIFTLPADGTYIIVATRYLEADGFSTGGYELTLDIVPAVPALPDISE